MFDKKIDSHELNLITGGLFMGILGVLGSLCCISHGTSYALQAADRYLDNGSCTWMLANSFGLGVGKIVTGFGNMPNSLELLTNSAYYYDRYGLNNLVTIWNMNNADVLRPYLRHMI